MAEGLSGMMREGVSRNLYRGFKVGAKEVDVNLLQYVDDTIFVGEFIEDNMVTLKSMMKCFEPVSSLKVNFHKSRFGGIGVPREKVGRFSKYLNCRILTIPFVYFEIPISTNPRKLKTWEPILVKFDKKFASWKHKHLSFVERICFLIWYLFLYHFSLCSSLKFQKELLGN